MKFPILGLILAFFLLSGCVKNLDNNYHITDIGHDFPIADDINGYDPVYGCVTLCQEQDIRTLASGPCLSDRDYFPYPDWVCDVVHNPRIAIDDFPENQCRKFREGKAHHFVEVTPACEFITQE